MAEKDPNMQVLNLTVVALVALVAIVGVAAIVLNKGGATAQSLEVPIVENSAGNAHYLAINSAVQPRPMKTGGSCNPRPGTPAGYCDFDNEGDCAEVDTLCMWVADTPQDQ